jgi:uncharacterized membrane protein YbhN (UPF0104 family)
VILLFFLLVTPEIVAAGVPQYMSMVLFIFPILFFVVLFNSRYHTQAPKRNLLVGIDAGGRACGLFLADLECRRRRTCRWCSGSGRSRWISSTSRATS